MSGTRLDWFRVASHLKIPVSELQSRITQSEFRDWLFFLRDEEKVQTKADYYQAQIAAEVRRSYVTQPHTVKTADFLLTFRSPSSSEVADVKGSVARKSEGSKHIWAAHLKVDVNKKP